MALVDVIKSCLDSIRQISEHIEGATVYLDAGCTESFQFIGALPVLLDLGACTVCSLENMCSLDVVVDLNSKFDAVKKIVVITCRLLSDAHRYILRCLSTHEGVHHYTIFTSISEMAHSSCPDSPLGPDAFHEYESLLVQDYEELVKKSETKCTQSKDDNLKDVLTFEDEGRSRFNSNEEDIPHLEASSSGRGLYEPIGLMEDVGKKLVVSVHHFPMILCPFSPRVFVLPSEGSIAEAYLSVDNEDSLSPGLPPLSTGLLSDGDDVSSGATLTAHFLYDLTAKMDLKMEIFSLGDVSKSVGKILTDMSSLYDVGRRKRSAGLLIIDRTLDLLTPCCHGDSLVDRMFSSLPHRKRATASVQGKGSQTQLKHGPSDLQRASLDVQIPLQKTLGKDDSKTDNLQLLDNIHAFLCAWDSSNLASQNMDFTTLSNKVNHERSVDFEVEPFCGSFVSTENFRGTPYLEAVLDRRTKDGSILVKKWLQEALRQENITVNVKNRAGIVTISELEAMIKALAKSEPSLIRNKGIIQLAAATLFALDESHCARWDTFISAERILGASAGDTTQSLAGQICDLVNKSALVGSHGQKDGKTKPSEGVLSLQDALLLTITGYILAGEYFPTAGLEGPFSWQEEHLLKEAIVDAILENPSIAQLKFLHGLTEDLEANLNRKRSEETREVSSNQLQIDDFDDDQWGNWGDEDADNYTEKEQVYGDMQLKLELRDKVDNLFSFLHKLSSLKSKNSPLRGWTLASESNFRGDTYTIKGLLYKLLTSVLGKYDIPGLEYHSSTVGRLFKSGLGRFGLRQAKPSLADQSIILVFVIGGINGLEVCEAQEALSEIGRPDIELIMGGTTFLTPDDMLDLLTSKSSYF